MILLLLMRYAMCSILFVYGHNSSVETRSHDITRKASSRFSAYAKKHSSYVGMTSRLFQLNNKNNYYKLLYRQYPPKKSISVAQLVQGLGNLMVNAKYKIHQQSLMQFPLA